MGSPAKTVMLTGTGFGQRHLAMLEAAGLRPVLTPPEAVIQVAREAYAYVLGGDERVTAHSLEAMPNLEAISLVGAGLDQFIDRSAAERRGVALMTTPGLMVEAVAEQTLGFLIGLQRGLFRHNDAAKRGGVVGGETRALSDSTIGIVGLGRIGLEVARQIRGGPGRSAELLYWSRSRKPEAEVELDLQFASQADIFSRSHSILLLLAATPETRGIVGEALFSQIRSPAFLVNTAAAELVDPAALQDAFRQGRIAGVAFDGYWQEPLPTASADPFGLLGRADGDFIVTPHVAARTSGAWPRMVDAAVENLVRHFGGDHGA